MSKQLINIITKDTETLIKSAGITEHLEFVDGDNYEGFWKNDKINGNGKYEFVNGARCEGEFVNGQLNGEGLFHFLNGNKYKGCSKS